MRKLVKVCGMRDTENIRQIAALEPDLMGFIFYPHSARYIRQVDLCEKNLDENLPSHIKRVGVFVQSPDKEVERIAKKWKLDYLQLHGNESPYFCQQLHEKGYKIIKVFSIGKEGINLEMMKHYEPCVDYFLFDTHTPKHGGSGKKFNWTILEDYNLETPFLLSGGITPKDAQRLVLYMHPKCVGYDINSKFEDAPALKNPDLVKEFISQIRTNES